jgi:uncharacterized membrane-anchored protein YjiN (DUF445 family)
MIDTPRSAEGMKRVATGLLVVLAVIYLLTRAIGHHNPALGFVRAFAEAAMVGGLADWFAVTALFRHPLGLPIPHTAIIPNNKDRIGEALARFLRTNFLTSKVVAKRMRHVDAAGAVGRFLSQPSGGDGRMRRGAARLLADLLQSFDHERLGGMVKAGIEGRIRALNLAPLLGQALRAAINEQRHLPLLYSLINWANRTLSANEDIVRQMVHDKAGSVMRWTGLDETLADGIITGLAKLLDEMATDPDHPMRAKAEEGLARFADDLQHDPEMHARVARFRDGLLDNPAMRKWIDGLWESARSSLLRAARDPEAAFAGKLGDTVRQFGETLQGDDQLRSTINRFARRALVGTAARYGDGVVKLVSDTIRGWDADTVTARIESAVGRDLQYIRLNGTLVGGLVGLVIHAADVWM